MKYCKKINTIKGRKRETNMVSQVNKKNYGKMIIIIVIINGIAITCF